MVVKTPAKKAANSAGKSAAAKKTPAKKTPAKQAARKQADKPAAAADKSVAKKTSVAAKKPTVAKPAAARKPPGGSSRMAKPAASPQAPSETRTAEKKTTVDEPVTGATPAVPPNRRLGKVAVAVASRPPTPSPRAKYKVVEYQLDEGGRPIVPDGYKPSAEEEYMSPLQLEYFRQRLLQWRAELVEESKQTIENLKDEVRDIGDEAERATRETENSLELRTRDRYRKLIGKIDSTLKRVDSGEYGFSVDSGEEIGLDRLEARLTAERTIDEQERWEHLQRQIGD